MRSCLCLTALEDRCTPADYTWIGNFHYGYADSTNANVAHNYWINGDWSTTVPGVGDTVTIDSAAQRQMLVGGQLAFDLLFINADAAVVRNLNDAPIANLRIDGSLTITGRAAESSRIDGGSISVDTGGNFGFASGSVRWTSWRLNMTQDLSEAYFHGGVFFYGDTDVTVTTTGTYSHNGGTWFVGRDYANNVSPATMTILTTDTHAIWLYKDAAIITSAEGVVNFDGPNRIQRGADWGGDTEWAGYGNLWNGGHMKVAGSLTTDADLFQFGDFNLRPYSDLIFTDSTPNNNQIPVTIAQWAGTFWQGNQSTVEAHPGRIELSGGVWVTVDEGLRDARFIVEGDMYLYASTSLVMDYYPDSYGVLVMPSTYWITMFSSQLIMGVDSTGLSDGLQANINTLYNSRLVLNTTGRPPVGTTAVLFDMQVTGDAFALWNTTQAGDYQGWTSPDGGMMPVIRRSIVAAW